MFFQKLTTFKTLTCFLAFIVIYPQLSTQQTIVNGTCDYKYDAETGLYSCALRTTLKNSTDILNIIGNHLPTKTDADVQKVTYFGSTVVCIHRVIMTKFPNIVILKVDTDGLKEIEEDAFQTCTHLEQYISGISDVTTYPPQMMKNCHKLKVFRAEFQSYEEIPEIFGNITDLEEVDLSFGRLKSLPDNFIKNKPNLMIFNLFFNSLAELAPNFFEGCPNLEEVDLGFNKFDDQDKIISAFNGNINLKNLAIGRQFTNFNFEYFSQFDKLKELTVEGTNLTQISWQSLPRSLEILNVESIGEDIAETSLNHLANLQTLWLYAPGITNLHKDTFKAQTNLKSLSIHRTSLKTLHPELFASQSNLLDLSLNNNQLEELPAGIFAPLVSLGSTNSNYGFKLARNGIKRLNANSFGDHPELKYLDFSTNQIDGIERGLFSKFNSNLTRADFRSNVCVNETFENPINLNNEHSLQWCFDSFEGITTTSTTTTTSAPPTTTPGGVGSVFKKFEVFVIIFIGLIVINWY